MLFVCLYSPYNSVNSTKSKAFQLIQCWLNDFCMIDSLRLECQTDRIIGCFEPFKCHDTTEHNRSNHCYKYVTLLCERYQVDVCNWNALEFLPLKLRQLDYPFWRGTQRLRESSKVNAFNFPAGNLFHWKITHVTYVRWLVHRNIERELHSRHPTKTALSMWKNRNVVNGHAHREKTFVMNESEDEESL